MDTISDFLTIIRNGYLNKTERLVTSHSKIKEELCKVFKDNGYLEEFKINQKEKLKDKQLEVSLKYNLGEPVLTHLKRISKPGLRIYKGSQKLKKVLDGNGLSVVSTPKGLMTDKEARKRHLGGEVICEVW